MNLERVKLQAEAYAIRSRSLFRTTVQVLGIAMVLIGAYNMLLGGDLFTFYREFYPHAVEISRGSGFAVIALPDVLLMAAGAIFAWFV